MEYICWYWIYHANTRNMKKSPLDDVVQKHHVSISLHLQGQVEVLNRPVVSVLNVLEVSGDAPPSPGRGHPQSETKIFGKILTHIHKSKQLAPMELLYGYSICHHIVGGVAPIANIFYFKHRSSFLSFIYEIYSCNVEHGLRLSSKDSQSLWDGIGISFQIFSFSELRSYKQFNHI